jgi:hypothetical protein
MDVQDRDLEGDLKLWREVDFAPGRWRGRTAASPVFFSAAPQLQSPEERIEDPAGAPGDGEVPVAAEV